MPLTNGMIADSEDDEEDSSEEDGFLDDEAEETDADTGDEDEVDHDDQDSEGEDEESDDGARKHLRQRCRGEVEWGRGSDEGIHVYVLHLALHWTTEFVVRFMTCWLPSSGLFMYVCREKHT